MAIIPLRSEVTVTPANGAPDEWGNPTAGAPYTLKCRVQEGTKLVRNRDGREAASTAQIYFDKLAPVQLTDTITFTDELGNTRTYTPISIEIKRDLAGKPILTVVNV